ncbi:hypothetical protein MNBD_ALPHA11-280 [hydrothermal vent metagenome]|uniref:Uncharacterized protein n=1 Tax=hydrothermal vent metagenome TaxID=652676 RepID=A0A3B0TZX9_9ZZZZ
MLAMAHAGKQREPNKTSTKGASKHPTPIKINGQRKYRNPEP